MRVLIHTIKNDVHAQAVQWALERKDCQVNLLFSADFPALSRSSLSLEHDIDLTVHGPELRENAPRRTFCATSR